MELTLGQALQKGVEAHKADNVQEADLYYTAIIKAQPKHPDANHNMGVLAVRVGKVETALPFFKTAIEANPKIEQFWLSYIDALIKLDRMAEAKAVFDQAKSAGIKGDKLDQIEHRLDGLDIAYTKNQDPPKKHIQALSDLYKKGQYREALDEATKLFIKFPKSVTLLNIIGALNKGLGKLDQALEAYKKTISLKPDNAVTYNNMGVVFQDQGKVEDAVKAYEKAISIKPNYAEGYGNMGVVLKDQGKLDDAVAAYTKALSLKPNYAEAYNNLGNALKDQGKLEDAIKVYSKAVSIKPNYADAYYNMGSVLNDQGKLEEAVKAYKKALDIKPDYVEAQHILTALKGETPKSAPKEYVEKLFDGYAKRFEATLVDMLDYQTPKLIKDILVQANTNGSLGSVLDLGCGTGLLGPYIKDHCSKLEGIDLSNKMLEIASQKKVYDKLSQSDIVEYLSGMPLDFDYFVALDVFIYVGELTEIFRLIKSRSKRPGKLVFSTEHTEKDGYHLLKTGRFSHSQSYILNLCEQFDYKLSHFSTNQLRKEKGAFLTGGLYVVEFTETI